MDSDKSQSHNAIDFQWFILIFFISEAYNA